MDNVYRVIEVEDRRNSDSPHWHVLMERPDGTRHAHVFPEHALDARAGEYGIPHDDVETLLDVILHEVRIPDPTDKRNHAADPAALKGMLTYVAGTSEPIWLYNAPSTTHARSAHMARIQHVKDNTFRVETAPGDALDVIRNAHKPNKAAVEAMTRHVERTRNQHLAQRRKLASLKAEPKVLPENHPLAEFHRLRET